MTSGNPLVATVEGPSGTEGGGIVDTVNMLGQEIEGGDAAGIAAQGVGFGLDALGMVMQPGTALLSAGLGMVIEHIEPLNWPLDQLAGDPGAINAASQTWHNIAAEMEQLGQDVKIAVTNETSDWEGQAGDAYRKKAAELAEEITAMHPGANGVAGAITGGGVLVGTVRALIRDLVTETIADLIIKGLAALGASWATFGASVAGFIAYTVGKVGITIGRIAAKIAMLLDRLGDLLRKLEKLGGAMGDLAKNASRFAKVGAVKLDDFASRPGRWIAGGGPGRASESVQGGFTSAERRLDVAQDGARPYHEAFGGQGVKAVVETVKGAEKAGDDSEQWRREAEEEFGGGRA
ncbi:MAG: WXG100 family type VII secretion target [Pseudonocardiaceae bacterium]